MNNATSLQNNANLALAAYSSLVPGPTADQLPRLTLISGAEMAQSQARVFAERYPTIVTQFSDTLAEGGTGSSFSVTVFKDTAGNVTLAFRGTFELVGSPNDIFPTDLSIFGSGAAYDQLVAMFNWWRRTSSVEGELVAQHRAVVSSTGALTEIVSAPDAIATGGLLSALAADPDGKVDLTGHSLGGHLAMAFNKLFSNVVNQVTVFNAPGFTNTSENQQFFARLGGIVPTVSNSANVTNVIADEAGVGSVPWNAIAGKHSRPGVAMDIATENQFAPTDEPFQFSSRNHSQAALADSLAVVAVLSNLDPLLTANDYQAITRAAAQGTAASYERVVDALEVLIGTDNRLMPFGNNHREKLHKAITDLNEAIFNRGLFGSVSILPITNVDAASLIQAANGLPEAPQDVTLAYRYALKELNPFVVTGNAAIYLPHNLGGELDFYDPVTRSGSLTQEWIADRAAFLSWKNIAFSINKAEFNHAQATELWRYVDLPRMVNIQIVPQGASQLPGTPAAEALTRRAVFGGTYSDVLNGGNVADRLYGDAGTDFLEGKKGNDYLEGGRGVDIYQYSGRAGLGVDNDGTDAIRDIDGKGVLRYTFHDQPAPQTSIAGGALVKVSATAWESVNGKFSFTVTTNPEGRFDLAVAISGDAGGSVTIKDWKEGDFGIRLNDISYTAPQNPVRIFIGDTQDFDSNTSNAQPDPVPDGFGNFLRLDGQGNPPRDFQAEVDRTDFFYGSEANEVEQFTTGGGDDGVYADGPDSVTSVQGGRDLIVTGAGSDIVAAGGNDDWVEGDAGADILMGNAGNDVIYADSSNAQTLTFVQAYTAGESGEAVSGRGDLLGGDGGDDLLIGVATADLIAGGDGRDIILGGRGNDTVYGDASITFAEREWDLLRTIEFDGDVQVFTVTPSAYSPSIDNTVGGSDAIYGGAGEDWIFAGAGDDYVDGGKDIDIIFGEDGSDVLIGGEGDDVMDGDSSSTPANLMGDDYLDGGAGLDTLRGNDGNDILLGGDGEDFLIGGQGNDVLIGGRDGDFLMGGAGKDTYVFNKGDGVELIQDPDDLDGNLDAQGNNTNRDKSIVVLGEGIQRSQVKFRKGSLLIDLGDEDAIHLDLPEGQTDPSLTRVFDHLQFADGSTMSFEEMLAQGFDIEGTDDSDNDDSEPSLEGTSVTDRIDAKSGDDIVYALSGNDSVLGRDGDDFIDGGEGDDFVDGGEGADVIDGGAGNDTIVGGNGADIIYGGGGDDIIIAGDDDIVDDTEGTNTLDVTEVAGLTLSNLEVTQYESIDGELYLNLHVRDSENPGVTPEAGGVSVLHGELGGFSSYTVGDGAGGTVTLSHADLLRDYTTQGLSYTARDEGDSLIGTPYDDTLRGGRGADTLTGNEGDDLLDGGFDDDVLAGGVGNDSYLLAYGNGVDTIIEIESADPGATNRVQLDLDVPLTAVAATRRGNDLEAELWATGDKLVIRDFYLRSQTWQESWEVKDAEDNSVQLTELLSVTPPAPEDWMGEKLAAFQVQRANVYATNRRSEGFGAIGGGVYRQVQNFPDYSNGTNSSVTTTRRLVTDSISDDSGLIQADTTFESTPQGGSNTSFQFGRPVLGGTGGDRSLDGGTFYPLPAGSSGFSGGGFPVSPGDIVVPVYQLRAGNSKQAVQDASGPDYASNGGYNSDQYQLMGFRVYHAGDPAAAGLPGIVSATDNSTIFAQQHTVTDIVAGGSDNTIFVGMGAAAQADEGNDEIFVSGTSYFATKPAWQSTLGLSPSDALAVDESFFPGGSSQRLFNALTAPSAVTSTTGSPVLGAFVDAGVGDDVVSGSGGDDVIAGGDGVDSLSGGLGSDQYLFQADDAGIDQLVESGNSDEALSYLDWYYWGQGIVNWDERSQYAGKYFARVVDGLPAYFDSPEEALAFDEFAFGIRLVEDLPSIALAPTRNDAETLEQLMNKGVLSRDIVQFGPGLALNDLDLTITVDAVDAALHPEQPWYGGGTLNVRWGDGGFDVEVPDVNYGFFGTNLALGNEHYRLGDGIEEFRFADGARYSLDQVLQNATVVGENRPFQLRRDSSDRTVSRNYEAIATEVGLNDIVVGRDGVDLIIDIPEVDNSFFDPNGIFQLDIEEGARARVQGWYSDPQNMPVTELRFLFEGQLQAFWDAETLTQLGLTVQGTSGDDDLQGLDAFADTLIGNDGNDTLAGGGDEDTLEGGEGDDVYVYGHGDGFDTISDSGGTDTVRFEDGVSPEDVGVTSDPSGSLYLVLPGSSNMVVLSDWFDEEARVESVEFANGTIWDAAELESRITTLAATEFGDVLSGTDNDDSIDGLAGGDRIYGLAGIDILDGGNDNDIIEGGAGNDLTMGGAGSDFIRSNDGSDFVVGGAGNDTIASTAQNSVIAFNAGDGNDYVIVGNDMTFSLGGGITASALSLSKSGNNLVLSVGENDSIRLAKSGFISVPWPQITLQLFGSSHLFDFNAVIDDFEAALIANPSLTEFPLDGVLQTHETAFSETEAMGGALAHQYATTGNLNAFSDAGIREVLADPEFGTAMQSIVVPGGGNNAPVVAVPIEDQVTQEDAPFVFSVPAGTFTDADLGDALTLSATLANGDPLPSWLSFNAGTGSFSGTPTQADVGSVEVRVSATDSGNLSVADTFTLEIQNVNDRPVVSATAQQTLLLNQIVDADSFYTVSDEDGDSLTQYEFWDSTAGNGHFTVNGIEQGVNVAIPVAAAELANTQFVGGAATGSDQVWVRANDGQAWSEWKSWTVNSWPHLTNAAPVATAEDAQLLRNDSTEASDLFTVVDGDNDAIVRYEFWDDVAGGGYFAVDGVAQGNNPIPVEAVDLADVTYVAGANPGTERVWVRANDGMQWGTWKPWNMTSALHIPNTAPVVEAPATQTMLLAQSVETSGLFSVTDADGDPIAQYEFWDSTAGSGHFTVNGVEQGVNTGIVVSAADLANTHFVGASATGSDLVWVRATDGQTWSDWKSWYLNSWPHLTNGAPVVSATDGTIVVNQAVAADSLFSVSDADADSIARYEFWDDGNGGGHFSLDGIQQGSGQAITVEASQLADVAYVGGAAGGTERVWARANDGLEWGAWKPWDMTTALHIPNAAPVVSANVQQTVLLGQTVAASGLFTVSDADSDPITQYEFWDSTAGNGHFTVNGAEQGVNAAISVTASQLGDAQFAGGSSAGSDQVWVRANDGQVWSDWRSWTMNSWPHLTNSAPVVSAQTAGLLRGEAVSAGGLFSVSDADGDATNRYEFWDDVNGGGNFRINGVQQAAGQSIAVAASDLANVEYVGRANAGTEQVWVRANDGMEWGAWKNWLMSTEGGMVRGGAGPDTLQGGPDTSILEGNGGNDTLTAGDGNSLVSGGEGEDAVTGGSGNDMLVGGEGDDTIETGGGNNVVSFNRGDGADSVTSFAGSENALSLGNGINYSDLNLRKDGDDLVLELGNGDSVNLKDWYADSTNQTFEKLQLMLDETGDFDPESGDPLRNQRVQTFDFRELVDQFDLARASNPSLNQWSMMNGLLDAHLAASDDEALGGDLAYYYGINGGLTGIGIGSAQQVIASPGFGRDAQSLRPFTGLQDGLVKLA